MNSRSKHIFRKLSSPFVSVILLLFLLLLFFDMAKLGPKSTVGQNITSAKCKCHTLLVRKDCKINHKILHSMVSMTTSRSTYALKSREMLWVKMLKNKQEDLGSLSPPPPVQISYWKAMQVGVILHATHKFIFKNFTFLRNLLEMTSTQL